MIYCGIILTVILVVLIDMKDTLEDIYLKLFLLDWREKNDKTRFGT